MTNPAARADLAPAPGGIAARARANIGAPYLAGLNPEQREAVETLDGPVLVLAGAGTGKNRVLTTDKVPPGEAASFAGGRGIELYKAYQARLKTLNAADFGDLLIEMLRLFREHPEVLRQYHERFKFILVDEYQDTNVAQYLWLRLIGQGSKNICCVGDDDQSIYGWRGAEVDNILRFEKDFPGARVIRLERNYRVTGHILGAAAPLIAHTVSS